MGIMTKLSCELPNTLPSALATPTTSYGLPSIGDGLADGSTPSKKRVADVVADERHGGVAAHLFVGDAAARYPPEHY